MLIFHGSSITFPLPSFFFFLLPSFSPFLLLESVFCENSWWWSAKNKTEQQCLRDPFHLFTIHTQHKTWLHSKTCNMEMRTLKKQDVTFEQVASTAGKKVDRRNERQVHASDVWRKHAKQCICFVHQHFHWAFVPYEKKKKYRKTKPSLVFPAVAHLLD